MIEKPTAEAVVDACLRVHEAALKIGDPEMIRVARLLLYMAGKQIADEIRAANSGGGRPTEN